MANENTTTIVNGTVQPRLYQVYGDLIESKEVMEPLCVASGVGPVCGFNYLDISSGYPKIYNAESHSKGSNVISPLVYLNTKEGGKYGTVDQAIINGSGLLFIAPSILEFTGNTMSWPDPDNPTSAIGFGVILRKPYSTTISNLSQSDFYIKTFNTDEYSLDQMLNWGVHNWIEGLCPVNLDQEEILVGIYLVGWDPQWSNESYGNILKQSFKDYGYNIAIIPYRGQLRGYYNGNTSDGIISKYLSLKVIENPVTVIKESSEEINSEVIAVRGIYRNRLSKGISDYVIDPSDIKSVSSNKNFSLDEILLYNNLYGFFTIPIINVTGDNVQVGFQFSNVGVDVANQEYPLHFSVPIMSTKPYRLDICNSISCKIKDINSSNGDTTYVRFRAKLNSSSNLLTYIYEGIYQD